MMEAIDYSYLEQQISLGNLIQLLGEDFKEEFTFLCHKMKLGIDYLRNYAKKLLIL